MRGQEAEVFPDGKPLIYQSLRILRVWDILGTYWAENSDTPPEIPTPPAPPRA